VSALLEQKCLPEPEIVDAEWEQNESADFADPVVTYVPQPEEQRGTWQKRQRKRSRRVEVALTPQDWRLLTLLAAHVSAATDDGRPLNGYGPIVSLLLVQGVEKYRRGLVRAQRGGRP
jgi:hypothetical protein